jgi:hypothetical protein
LKEARYVHTTTRPLRIEYPGAVYHVTSRGSEKKAIFKDDQDRENFLNTLQHSGGYTYVCLENSGKKTWVAVPETKVKVGQMVTCQPGGEMKNFTSKTLKRTFESIIFSGGIS